MRIIIFGGTGLLGQAIYFNLNKKHSCYISSLKKKSDFKNNLQSSKKIMSFLKKKRIDVVINCAGETDVNLCNKNFYHAYKSNVNSIKNIANAIQNLKKKIYLIHISTDQVYSSISKASKESEVVISNNYGATKFFGEIEALKVRNSLVIRTNFFGKSISKNRISYSDYIISNLKDKKKISIPSNVIFSPVHINFILKIINKIIKIKIKGILNVGSKNSITKFEFTKLVAKKFNLNQKNIIPYKSDPSVHHRPLNTSMNTSKLISKLKISVPSINDGLKLL